MWFLFVSVWTHLFSTSSQALQKGSTHKGTLFIRGSGRTCEVCIKTSTSLINRGIEMEWNVFSPRKYKICVD